MQTEPIGILTTRKELGQKSATEKVVGSFAEALKGLFLEVKQADIEAVELKRRFLTGEPVELHEVLIAVEKTQIAFQTLLAVRNKLLEAYHELSRMPI